MTLAPAPRVEPKARHLAIVALLAALGATPAFATLDGWLEQRFGLSARELARLSSGAPVVRTMDAADPREVALVGAVRIPVSPEAYIAQLRDITRFKRGRQVQAIGRFGAQPVIEDLSGLELTDDEVEALRRCQTGDCSLQLSQPMFVMQQAVRASGTAPDAYLHAFRKALVDVVAAYGHDGVSALPTYVDDDDPVVVPAEITDLVKEDKWLLAILPQWRERLLRGGRDVAAEDSLVYWSREQVGRASVVSITHLTVGRANELAQGAWIAASLQLYATHYFDASLGLTVLWPSEGGATLIYFSRSRVDTFEGWMGGMLRRMVQSRARAAMRTHLLSLQAKMR